jgi:hypothetical protein
MPESVTDRLSTKHEHVFMFSKRARYWFNLDPIREPLAFPADRPQNSWARDTKEADVPGQTMRQHRQDRPGKGGGTNLKPTGRQHLTPDDKGGRNPGDVWSIPTQPYPEAHFATMPWPSPNGASSPDASQAGPSSTRSAAQGPPGSPPHDTGAATSASTSTPTTSTCPCAPGSHKAHSST